MLTILFLLSSNSFGCSEGKWSAQADIISDAQCLGRCSPGKWSSTSGLSSDNDCEPCSEGKWSSSQGLTTDNACQLCPKGRYSLSTGLAASNQCLVCPKGYSQAQAGKEFCMPVSIKYIRAPIHQISGAGFLKKYQTGKVTVSPFPPLILSYPIFLSLFFLTFFSPSFHFFLVHGRQSTRQ